MHRFERIFAAFMRGMLQISQTHCVYMLDPKDFDAFASDPRHPDRASAR